MHNGTRSCGGYKKKDLFRAYEEAHPEAPPIAKSVFNNKRVPKMGVLWAYATELVTNTRAYLSGTLSLGDNVGAPPPGIRRPEAPARRQVRRRRRRSHMESSSTAATSADSADSDSLSETSNHLDSGASKKGRMLDGSAAGGGGPGGDEGGGDQGPITECHSGTKRRVGENETALLEMEASVLRKRSQRHATPPPAVVVESTQAEQGGGASAAAAGGPAAELQSSDGRHDAGHVTIDEGRAAPGEAQQSADSALGACPSSPEGSHGSNGSPSSTSTSLAEEILSQQTSSQASDSCDNSIQNCTPLSQAAPATAASDGRNASGSLPPPAAQVAAAGGGGVAANSVEPADTSGALFWNHLSKSLVDKYGQLIGVGDTAGRGHGGGGAFTLNALTAARRSMLQP
jgi:hypothetical protein